MGFWGLLWYQSEGTLEDRVRNAASRYREKYGEEPNTCFVHPKCIDESFLVDGCRVVGASAILDNHLWIGKEETCD